jgi:hypothetical protein
MRTLGLFVAVVVALLASTASGQGTYGQRVASRDGRWLSPVASRLIGSNEQDHLNRGSVYAWDWSASVGTPIFPLADGVVILASTANEGGYGHWMYIRHGDYEMVYAHMQPGSMRFKKGDTVRQWDVIGAVGMTGMTSWPHTHLEIRHKTAGRQRIDKFFDPASVSYCKFCKSQNQPKDQIGGVQLVGGMAQTQTQQVNRVPYWWILTVYLVLVGAYAISGYSKWSQHAIYHGMAMFTAVLMFVLIGGVLPGVGQGQVGQAGQAGQAVQASSVSGSINGGAAWDLAYRQTMKWEGSTKCVHDPYRTKRGITQGTFNAWRKSKGMPAGDVCNITEQEAKLIYYYRYWLPSGADKLPTAVAMTHYDMAVNAGVGVAKGMLAQCGNNTTCYNRLRKSFYLSAKSCSIYCAGWLNRLADMQKVTE